MAAGRSRFASLNDGEFDDLLNRKDSENTQKATKKAVTVFREYLSAKNRPEDFENFEKDELGNVLSRFYVEARRSDGNHYKTSSLNGVRAGLNRHLKQNYYLGSGTIDIIRDKDFVAANMAFRAAIVELKKKEKAMCSTIKQSMKMTLQNCTVPVYSTKILLLDYNLKFGLN